MGILTTMGTFVLPMLGKLAIPADVIRKGADAFFDVIEDHVESTESGTDDFIVGNAIRGLRAVLQVPDDFGGDTD